MFGTIFVIIVIFAIVGSIGQQKSDTLCSHISPFNIPQNEARLILMSDVIYVEKKAKTRTDRTHIGFSAPVTKKIRMNMGVSKSHPIEYDKNYFFGPGMLELTNKAIYFASRERTFRIPYNKIVKLLPIESGVEFSKEGTSQRSHCLIIGGKSYDGYHLIKYIIGGGKSAQIISQFASQCVGCPISLRMKLNRAAAQSRK
ncbi:MAG: hypothetical protein LBO74_02395 [Candidatus Symbiothrix sp.]|jgi:hypothetical protein|nr:hypothetical protein [Candidatus Symbiothrix sp.]